MAALVAAKLSIYLTKLFPELCHQKFLWSYSQITIYWIKGCARNWKHFVSNKVSEIQSLTDPECWFHCSGSEKPTDLLSRGKNAFNLVRSSLWLQGPSWISQPESVWPVNQRINIDEESVQNEARVQTSFHVSVQDVGSSALLELTRFSRLLKVYRITAYVMLFTNNIKRNPVKVKSPLSSVEISRAELYWGKVTQRKYFAKETLDLSSGKCLEKTSSIYSLNPELDTHDLLHLKGRLQFSDFAFEEKHPWLLPYKDRYSELVIFESHTKLFHAGVEATLADVREKFWIIKGRQFVKSTLRAFCVNDTRLAGLAALGYVIRIWQSQEDHLPKNTDAFVEEFLRVCDSYSHYPWAKPRKPTVQPVHSPATESKPG
ncbi:uncharacterized protein LOC118184472 [Stegodyphus dumicola]|uniref:uncharacterized protein LOC118184472 n=1 Tax=Stegodyphus dumicola TaxID=202533 RepID=UPI0015B21946|nr:uncharacterized protein LOC118184472 [Stegodyphus dumicola]